MDIYKNKLHKNCLARIKRELYKYETISRAQLSELLSVTPATITANINVMLKEGLVQEKVEQNSAPTGALGRKPVMLEYVAESAYVVGVECNAVLTAIVVLDLSGKTILSKEYPVAPTEYEEMLTDLSGWIEETVAQTGILEEKLLGIGIGVPGYVESQRGIIKQSHRETWLNKPFTKDLGRRLSLRVPIALCNNVQMRATGADLLDKTICVKTFAYFYVYYGIACSLVENHDLFPGHIWGSGEVGHMILDLSSRRMGGGDRGILASVAGERAIIQRCQELMEYNQNSILHQLVPEKAQLTMEHVLKAQKYNDPMVCQIVNEAIIYLAAAVSNIINFVKPEAFLFDAYIMRNKKNRECLMALVEEQLYGIPISDIDFRFMDSGVFYGAVGAGAYALKEFFINKE